MKKFFRLAFAILSLLAVPLFGTPQHENVLIMGSGPAGLTAAIYTSRAGLSTLIIEGEEPGGQISLSYSVENFPGFPEGINGYDLGEKIKEQALQFGTKIQEGKIVKIDLSRSPFILEDETGQIILADVLIIASGASAKWLGLESEKAFIGEGVSSCAVCDGFQYKNKEVVVVGGGDTALEDALFLANYASKVTVVHRRDTLKASHYLQNRAFANEKIHFIWNSVVEEIADPLIGEISSVTIKNVVTQDKNKIPCKGVFVAIGHAPNTDLFKGQLHLDQGGYIITEPRSTKTNIPGVFAAGDVADSSYRQAITAAGTGCMAGMDAYHFIQEQTALVEHTTLSTADFLRSIQRSLLTEVQPKSSLLSVDIKNVKEVLASSPFVILDVYTDWCGPCKRMSPILKELNQEFGSHIQFAKLDAEEEEKLANLLKIRSYPTIIFFKDGKEVARKGSMNKSEFIKQIEKNFSVGRG